MAGASRAGLTDPVAGPVSPIWTVDHACPDLFPHHLQAVWSGRCRAMLRVEIQLRFRSRGPPPPVLQGR
jgi:hypothetical protein